MRIEIPQGTFAWNPVSYTTSFQLCSCTHSGKKQHSNADLLSFITDPQLQHVPRWGSGGGSCHWWGPDVMPHAAGSSPAPPDGAPQSLGPCCLPTACATQTLPAWRRTKRQLMFYLMILQFSWIIRLGFASYVWWIIRSYTPLWTLSHRDV